VISLLRVSDAEFLLVDTVVQRLVSVDEPACFNSAERCQLHQFFLLCSVETRLVVEAIKDMQSLKDTCRLAFEGAQTNPVRNPAASERDATPHGAVGGGRGSLPKVGVFH